jgi:hypothetical protein
MTETPKIDKFIDEIFFLKSSHKLLENLFDEIGPYKHGEISSELWYKVCNHFNFDDSE